MRAIVFDLDGTLVDSAPDIRAAVNRMLAEQGRAGLSLATVTSFVGNGLPRLVELVIGETGLDMADHAALTARTLELYNRSAADLTRPYPGVPEMLAHFAAEGFVMGVCTNKPAEPARHVLDALGIGHHIAALVGGDSLPQRKPDPAPLLRVAADLGADGCVYVGDSEVDAATAAAAGMRFALFTQGYRKSPVADLAHDAAFDDFAELPAIVARLATQPA